MAWREGAVVLVDDLDDGEVLELGPGPGTFTLSAVRKVGPHGTVLAVDIRPRMIAALQRKLRESGATNVEALVSDAYDLPIDSGSIDRAV